MAKNINCNKLRASSFKWKEKSKIHKTTQKETMISAKSKRQQIFKQRKQNINGTQTKTATKKAAYQQMLVKRWSRAITQESTYYSSRRNENERKDPWEAQAGLKKTQKNQLQAQGKPSHIF